MLRRLLSIASIGGLLITATLWLVAAVAAWTHPQGAHGVTFGYGNGQKWLVNALVYSDGELVCRLFQPNLTHHKGFYGVRMSGLSPWHSGQTGFIRSNQFSRSMRLHMALPLLIFAAFSFVLVGMPMLRRSRCRRRGLCLRCGYDLRHAQDTRCPECGRESGL